MDFIEQYQRRFAATWNDGTPIENVRFVAIDSETTGLNPVTDRIITIGAVAVQDGDILLEDSFEALLRVERNTAAVAVHGITRDETHGGLDEPEALRRFLDYLQDGVTVGHRIGHDIDSQCDLFGVIPHDRHTAGGDAFITAQVFLRLLRLASRHGRDELGSLCEPFES